MAYEKQNFENGMVLTGDHLAHIEEGIAAAHIMIVTLSDSGATASHTPEQIQLHVQSGGSAVLQIGSECVSLSRVSPGAAIFNEMGDDYIHYVHTIDANARYTAAEMQHASQEAVGDISEAMDAIIALQEELIGS